MDMKKTKPGKNKKRKDSIIEEWVLVPGIPDVDESSLEGAGELIDVDSELKGFETAAEKSGKELEVATIRALDIDENEKPYCIRIAPGTKEEKHEAIFRKAQGIDNRFKATKLLALLAFQGYDGGQEMLAFRFHVGIGVMPDLDIAIYWYKRAAQAGNTYAKQNLCSLLEEAIERYPERKELIEELKCLRKLS